VQPSEKPGKEGGLAATLPGGAIPVVDPRARPVASAPGTPADPDGVNGSAGRAASLAPAAPTPRVIDHAADLDGVVAHPVAYPVGALSPPRSGQSVGRFLVVKQLGSGAMGLVLAAYDPLLDRKVALKLLHQGLAGDSAGRQRLLREAQAMARLSHPNVVTVFEVGTVDATVFLAMEHIDGTTLADWMTAGPRPWRAVLAHFTAAGRGLAAAHAAGVVHRDFKPDNVLVATDGRVRVGDFGLASALPGNRLSATTAAVAPPLEASPTLTQDGSLIGTPLYMSPEQHRGAPADARSDQFSFCVALYEAMYRETPFAGDSYAAYADEVLAGRVRPPPRGADVPAWLRAVLLRGIATEPDDRYPSMDGLLDALARDPAQRRRRVAAGLGVAVLAGLAVYGLVGGRGAAASGPCAASDEASRRSLAGAWDDPVRAGVARAFATSRRAGARGDLVRVERALDERTGAIVAMRRDACEATHARGEQSAELLDRRIQCLDRRVSELRAMTGLLARADDEVIARSVEAVLALAPVDQCADAAALLAAVPPPADPALRARVDAARRKLAELDALIVAGKYRPALDLARAAEDETRSLGYAPVHAEAVGRLGELQLRLSDPRSALGTFERAVAASAEAHDDGMFAKAVTQLYQVTGYGNHKLAEAAALLPVARAAVARAGGGAELRALLDGAIGAVAQSAGHYQEAADAFARALESTEAALGPDDPRVGAALNNLGHATSSLGHYREALELYRRALAVREKALGPDHPQVANSLSSVSAMQSELADHQAALAGFERVLAIREAALGPDHLLVADALESVGTVLSDLGRYDDALARYRRALALREAALGPDHVDVAGSAGKLGALLHTMGRDAEAIPYQERALAIREVQLGPDHPEIAGTLNNLALTVRRRDHARARALLRRALAIREKTVGPDHPDTASTINNLALEEYEAEHYPQAIALYRRALAIWDKSLGPAHPSTLMVVYYLGYCELEAGHAAAARALFERALAGYESLGDRARAKEVPSVRVALAEALWKTHRKGDRARARREVTAVHRLLVASGRGPEAAELRRWLARHRR